MGSGSNHQVAQPLPNLPRSVMLNPQVPERCRLGHPRLTTTGSTAGFRRAQLLGFARLKHWGLDDPAAIVKPSGFNHRDPLWPSASLRLG
ncbi:MAG: hypothetical protein JWQ56_3271 [Pseudarthrobacter sp.]|nr:hypothetical protein [Pseudarthrobacter sp.]